MMEVIGKWTGRTYQLEQIDGIDGAPDAFARPFWTYSYLSDSVNGYGERIRCYPTTCYLNQRHRTAALAASQAQQDDYRASASGEPLSRPDYERECARLCVAALSDSECDSYGVKYGDFDGFGYDIKTCVQMALARRRLKHIEAARSQQMASIPRSPPKTPTKDGQLWEPCTCGNEPIYMPLHVCDDCWPK